MSFEYRTGPVPRPLGGTLSSVIEVSSHGPVIYRVTQAAWSCWVVLRRLRQQERQDSGLKDPGAAQEPTSGAARFGK